MSLYLVNFGAGKASLATVGYALYDADGDLYQARTTTGVTERPAGTGIYGVDATIPAGFIGEIRWDTGEVTPAYASEVIDGYGEITVTPVSGALTTIALVKAMPNIGTFTDGQISQAINAATDAIQNYCNRIFASTIYTAEKYDGKGYDMLYLKQYPITAVSAVLVNYATISASDYSIEEQGLYMIGGYWAQGRKNISVSYTAGYSTLPDGLVMASTRIVADMLSETPKDGNLQSEKIGDYSYSLGGSDYNSLATASVAKNAGSLAPYKRWLV